MWVTRIVHVKVGGAKNESKMKIENVQRTSYIKARVPESGAIRCEVKVSIEDGSAKPPPPGHQNKETQVGDTACPGRVRGTIATGGWE